MLKGYWHSFASKKEYCCIAATQVHEKGLITDILNYKPMIIKDERDQDDSQSKDKSK